ncbi:hypothetical protein ACLOJK_027408 [Asimina triloba]
MEGRALKFLGDLVPVQSRAIRESAALGLQGLQDVEGSGAAELMLRELLPHVWEELYDLERRIRSIDGCSSPEEELEALLERRYVEGVVEGEQRFFYELREMAKAVDAAEALRQNLYVARLEQEGLKEDMVGLLIDLAATKAERDEAVNGAEAAREEASGLSAELAATRFEVEALRARDVDSNVNGVESRAELEAARGVAKLLSESEVARAEVARLRVELEASHAEVACLRVVSSQGGDA